MFFSLFQTKSIDFVKWNTKEPNDFLDMIEYPAGRDIPFNDIPVFKKGPEKVNADYNWNHVKNNHIPEKSSSMRDGQNMRHMLTWRLINLKTLIINVLDLIQELNKTGKNFNLSDYKVSNKQYCQVDTESAPKKREQQTTNTEEVFKKASEIKVSKYKEKIIPKNEIEFIGDIKHIQTKETIQMLLPNLNFVKEDNKGASTIEGIFEFLAFGSQTLTSDIDITVKFLSSRAGYEKSLQAAAQFIEIANFLAQACYGKSLLEAFDINFYTDFYEDEKVEKLMTQFDETDLKIIHGVDHYTQLLLIESILSDPHTTAKNVKALDIPKGSVQNIQQKIQNIKAELQTFFIAKIPPKVPVNNGSPNKKSSLTLEKVPIELTGCQQLFNGLLASDRYEETKKERNSEMVLAVKTALNEIGTVGFFVCAISANYYAYEAYISMGSILDIMDMQKTGDAKLRRSSPTLYKIFKKEPNFVIDALLMNFGYGIEHILKHHSDKPFVLNDVSKFVKYVVRVRYDLRNIKEGNAEFVSCWVKTYQDFMKDTGIIITNNEEGEVDVGDYKTKLNSYFETGKNNIKVNPGEQILPEKQTKISNYIKDGLVCILKPTYISTEVYATNQNGERLVKI